jgi:putative intracellular protease/amidase
MRQSRMLKLLAVLLLVIAGCAPAQATTVLPTAVPTSTVAMQPTATLPPTPTAQPRKVLLIVREASAEMELMLTKEVNKMARMLEDAGFQVKVATVSGQPLVGASTTLAPDLRLEDVRVEDYVGFMVPCMAAGNTEASLQVPPEALQVVKEAAVQGKPLAAQLSGVIILDSAGVLEGKQFAIRYDMRLRVHGGTFSGDGVVQDGNITTSGSCPYTEKYGGNPDTTVELTQKFIESMRGAG